jgi:hypothetical protein
MEKLSVCDVDFFWLTMKPLFFFINISLKTQIQNLGLWTHFDSDRDPLKKQEAPMCQKQECFLFLNINFSIKFNNFFILLIIFYLCSMMTIHLIMLNLDKHEQWLPHAAVLWKIIVVE